MRAFMKITVLFACLVSLSGCTKRAVLHFKDHPTKELTYIETLRMDDYYISRSVTHEFWICEDKENELVCEKSCDGASDLTCPAAGMAVGIAGSNVR